SSVDARGVAVAVGVQNVDAVVAPVVGAGPAGRQLVHRVGGAEEGLDHGRPRQGVGGEVARGLAEVDQLVNAVLLQVGQEEDVDGVTAACARGGEGAAGWELPGVGLVIVQGQADLVQIVLTGHLVGGLADPLDGGDQQPDQDGDDGDHDEQL